MPHVCTSFSGRRWRHFVPSLLVLTGITYLSLIKEMPAPVLGNIPLADKWGHMLAYMVLSLCMAADSYRAHISVRGLYLTAILLPIAYGGLIELIQPHFPPRQGEWMDWLADCIGVSIGILIFAVWYFLMNRRKTPSSTSNA